MNYLLAAGGVAVLLITLLAIGDYVMTGLERLQAAVAANTVAVTAAVAKINQAAQDAAAGDQPLHDAAAAIEANNAALVAVAPLPPS